MERQQLFASTQTPGSGGLARHPLQLSKKKSLFFRLYSAALSGTLAAVGRLSRCGQPQTL
jgi:hypothetical protein